MFSNFDSAVAAVFVFWGTDFGCLCQSQTKSTVKSIVEIIKVIIFIIGGL
jgi:hypothetical protein